MKRRVLIVDDSPEDREVVAVALRQDMGVRYTLVEAATGSHAIELLHEAGAGFDLLFLDFQLPDMNAAEFVEQLLGPNRVPTLPIIVLTGSIDGGGSEANAISHGVQDFFTKREITPGVLKRVARNAIERHRMLLRLVASEEVADQARAEAEQANRAKSQFLTLVSHELRTPLTAVLGFAELLQREPLADDAQRMLQMIASSGAHLAELLNDLIDIAKVEAGTLDVDPAGCNIRQLIGSTCQLLAVRASDKGLTLRVDLDASLPEVVCSDALRLRQILTNLIGNAIKFTDQGSVECRARWDASDSRLTIWVSDTGPGIPADVMSSIFTPFVQGGQRGNGQRDGIGLGLAIGRRLAELMDGDLEVESSTSSGTAFRLSVEAHLPKDAAAEDPQSIAGDPLQDSVPDLRGRRLLVAEDTEANRYLITRLLDPTGVHVDFAVNGAEALDLVLGAHAKPYDTIIMDMLMPVLDGFSATEKLRAAGVRTRIIALTAAAFADDQQRCRDVGCNEVLTKPIDTTALYHAIRI